MKNKEFYVTPETEIIPISMENQMLNGLSSPNPSGEKIEDGGSDLTWPTN